MGHSLGGCKELDISMSAHTALELLIKLQPKGPFRQGDQ